MTDYFNHNGTTYVHVSDFAAVQTQLAKHEQLLKRMVDAWDANDETSAPTLRALINQARTADSASEIPT